jgi:hypothetical protein
MGFRRKSSVRGGLSTRALKKMKTVGKEVYLLEHELVESRGSNASEINLREGEAFP